ncbi:MAG: copper chaperone PCu(A)C, partial [Caulobacteraceae bacterium]
TRLVAPGATLSRRCVITNTSPTADRLVVASSAASGRVSIHESRLVGQVMTMRALDAVAIPAGAAVAFKPGGLHLMLEGLKAPLKAGGRIAVTLIFAKAGCRPVTMSVRDGPPAPAMAGMKM